jgi:apolipoprotein N-acyltransferase
VTVLAQLALAGLSGVLYFVGFVGFGQHYLTWVCFVPVLWAIRQATPRRALLLGTVFGTVMSLGGFYWVQHMLAEFAHLGPLLSGLGLVLLCLQQGLGLGLVLWAVRRLGDLPPVWALTLALTAQELLYPHIFPFYIGASQYTLPWVTQVAELVGIVGLAPLIALVNGAVYELVEARLVQRPWARRRVLVPLGVLAATLLFGAVRTAQLDARTAQGPHLRAALIQTNLGASDKHTQADLFIQRHIDMSKEAVARDPSIDLLVWPESAYNRWMPKNTAEARGAPFAELGRPLIFGVLMFEKVRGEDPRAYNSAAITSSTGVVLGTYDKIELLVFGETIPLVDTFPVIKKWLPMSSTFTRGAQWTHLVGPDGTKFLPMICYEDILPRFVRQLWDRAGPADVLVNVTNDSWYGDTHEPIEHLALATFRSIETRRALIRSTNTGISAIVDPVGRLTARSGQWTREVVVADVPLVKDGSTTVYQTIGDAPALAACAVLLWLLLARRRRPT